MTGRVEANFAELDNYVATAVGLDQSWQTPMSECSAALAIFFASNSQFGPTASAIPERSGTLANQLRLLGVGVAATSEAFKQIDALMRVDEFGVGMYPTDEGVENLRRAYLQKEWPDLADELSDPAAGPRETLRTLEELQEEIDTFWHNKGGGAPEPVQEDWDETYADLLEEYKTAANDALISIEQLQTDIEESEAAGRSIRIDLALRNDLIEAITPNKEMATLMIGHMNDGMPAREAFIEAEGDHHFDLRIEAVMIEQDVSADEARRIIAEVDAITIELLELGHPPDAAAAAGVIGQASGLSAEEIDRIAKMFETNAGDAAAIGLYAMQRDMTPEQFGTYTNLQVHFETIAQDTGEPVITKGDLDYIDANPHEFDPAVVMTVRQILADPAVYFRLDNAATNNDILDSDSFGALGPDDWKIGQHEFAAFELKQHINNYLGDWGVTIDTMNGGGPDGTFSGDDYRDFLNNLPPELQGDEHAIALLTQIIDGKMYDQGWFERNMDALIMIGAVLAGVGAVLLTGGAATPLLMTLAVGFAAGAGTAGALTLGGNAYLGKPLTDGLAMNMIKGGFAGMAGAAMPGTIATLTTSTGAYGTTAAALGLVSETSGIVALGGADIVLPDDWEEGVHGVSEKLSLVTGVGAITMVGGRWVIRRVATEAAENTTTFADDFANWGNDTLDDTLRMTEQPGPGPRLDLERPQGQLFDSTRFDHVPIDAPTPLGRGSTGPNRMNTLKEQLAMAEVRTNPSGGTRLNVRMTDPRWRAEDGWIKKGQHFDGTEIHWVYNTITSEIDDIKFIYPRPRRPRMEQVKLFVP